MTATPATLGLIGFGALGRQLAAEMGPHEARWLALTRHGVSGLPTHVAAVDSLAALIAARPAAVVEVAGPLAVAAHVPALLEAAIPVVLASVGALADDRLAARLEAASIASGAPLVRPAGAVGGLDYLAAIAHLPDARLRYTSRKPPAAWAEELAARGLDAGRQAVVLFEGSAEEAARRFPRNLNAGLTLALACRPAPLAVRVVADPEATGNTHEIEAESAAGVALLRFVNAPSPANPKTSLVTALSLLAALRSLLAQRRPG